MTNFIKHNYKDNDTLVKEAADIQLLTKYLDPDFIKTPKIIQVSKQTLELERILSQKPNDELMANLGTGLAKLHKHKFKQYGFEEDNFIGLNVQKNELRDDWGEFFYHNRLKHQVNLIKTTSVRQEFEDILIHKHMKLIHFLNDTCAHPSLVHGDLWSGNVMFDKNSAWLIDPSSYYADREVDIAMTELFLGFNDSFYEAYNNEYALTKEYEQKKIIYNLYHTLNHYNLFGQSYLKDSKKAFEFISSL